MALDYWYDGQLRRYWLQFCRIFEGFQYESGVDANGVRTRRYFPVKLASKNRQIGHILRNGSENTVLSTPQITCEMTSIRQSAERRQTPNHVRTVNVWERAIDEATNTYTGQLGQTYSVETYMAIPYDITMRVNIWTSNEMQKHQFMEQVLILFNPSIDLQTGDNAVDWTSLGIVELLGDEIQWTNREMPIGTDDDIEVSTLSFKMPIWLSPPAKIKRQNIIHQIIMNIGMMDQADKYQAEQGGGYNFSTNDDRSRVIVTPGNHQVRMEVERGPEGMVFTGTLLTENGHRFVDNWRELAKQYGIEIDEQDPTAANFIEKINDPRLMLNWKPLLDSYGAYRPAVSQFRLKTTNDMDDHDSDIVGTFDFTSAPNKILWTPDVATLPRETLQTIHGVISLVNPELPLSDFPQRFPGDGLIPEAKEGDRYLLTDDLNRPDDSVPQDEIAWGWGGAVASANDIIEYKNGKWVVSFDASATTDKFVVLNGRSGKQLRWNGEIWLDAVSGDYMPGYWRVFL